MFANAINQIKQRPLLTAIVIFFVVFVIIAIIVLIQVLPEPTRIDISVSPRDATIRVNSKTYNNGIHDIEAGKYTINVSKDGFLPYEGAVSVEANQTTNIWVALEPADNTPMPDSNDTRTSQEIADQSVDQFRSAAFNKYPIMNYLPIKAANFTIVSGFSDNYNLDSFYIRISSTGDSETAALNYIRNMGFDPGDYNIIFSSFTNPFTGGAK